MPPQKIWFEDTTVRSADTDFQSRWKLSSVFAAMVEAAAHHAEDLGCGYEEMLAHDLVWILSRLKICVFDLPRLNEKVTIQTWPKPIQQKIFFMRDYHVLGKSGRKYASATSAYILVNPRTRRMAPPQSFFGSLPENNGLHALDESLDRISAPGALEEQFVTRAGYSAVDLMGHVNNTRYIDWVSDCFSFAEHQSHRLSQLQINYINEVKPGDTVALLRGADPAQPGNWYILGSNQASAAKAFEALVSLEEEQP